jgi:multimeric flavodoxin WrbA
MSLLDSFYSVNVGEIIMSQDNDNRLVVAINGGPRKHWNTALLLEETLKGAESEGVKTKIVHLYDLKFKGCVSCFGCKRKESYQNGRCAYKDELSEVLSLLEGATGVVMGSPIYLGDVTGALRSFWERYLFMNLAYDKENPYILESGPGIGVIYAMNIPENMLTEFSYDKLFKSHLMILDRLRAPFAEQILSCDTLQFDDYGKYHAPMFDPKLKKISREERFPKDLEKAFLLGKKLAGVKEPRKLLKDGKS